MWMTIVLAAFLPIVYSQSSNTVFPDGFMLGASTSSYQIEGAWNEDGKGESNLDRFFHEHPETSNGDNGDIACDSYHKYKEDVQMLKAINANIYRFSISWSRILPTGDLDVINQPGIDYYNNLINELLANGIQPLVTMSHFDLPQPLEYIGGWPNELIADYYVEYARVLFENFGDRVKWWITFNEPALFVNGYATSNIAPGQPASGIGDYLATHTVLKAHARVYRMYDEQYRVSQNGHVGISLDISGHEPLTNSTEDMEAAERALQFQAGLYAHPIFSAEGDYPAVARQRVDNNSRAEGRPRSRLPSFTAEEVDYIRGSADFFGLNHYATNYDTSGLSGDSPSKARDSGVISSTGGNFAWGFRNVLNWIVDRYPGYPIFVTENGVSTSAGLNDTERIEYYHEYLTALLDAIHIDGVPVIGYTTWSLMDNFEWNSGYSTKLGLYKVDFESNNRTRTPRLSAGYISEIFKNKQLPMTYFLA